MRIIIILATRRTRRRGSSALEVIGALDIAKGKEFVIPVPSKGISARNR